MKRFLFLHVGFEPPSPEQMDQWKAWFASIAERQLDQAGFAAGRELSHEGTVDLPWDKTCLTGYNMIEAESLDEAEQLAKTNPFVSSIRIYELR